MCWKASSVPPDPPFPGPGPCSELQRPDFGFWGPLLAPRGIWPLAGSFHGGEERVQGTYCLFLSWP